MKHKNDRVFLDFADRFSQESFLSPQRDFLPVYTWIWSERLSYEETDRTLEELQRLGIKVIYILPEPTTFRPVSIITNLYCEYMGKEYMDHYVYAVNKAISMGMILWLYDEAGWPSGSAGNIVLYDHPEYAKKILASRVKTFSKGEIYKSEDDCTAFLNGEIIYDGYEFSEDSRVSEYYSKLDIFPNPGISDYPDLSLKAATDYFIEVTHEAYKKHIGSEFGVNIPIVFTDEAVLAFPTPYRPELEREFEDMYGVSIRPCLPILNKERLAVTDYEKSTVIKWYDYCSRLFCDNFLEPYKNWCHENGMAFSGHFNIDHIPNGAVASRTFNLMRALRYLDIPGVDAIWRQIFPGEKKVVQGNVTCENRFFPRFASSAASQIGSPRAMTESFGVYGAGLTFEDMRYVLNFQAIRGINMFNIMSTTYGESKGFCMATGGKFREKYACIENLPYFNEYVSRICYLTSIGKNVCDVALYLPTKDMYLVANESDKVLEFDRAGEVLENRQIPFDLFDDDVLLLCDRDLLKKGVISMGDASYTCLVITDAEFMPDDVRALASEFVQGGGKVIVTREYLLSVIEGSVYSPDPSALLSAPLELVGDTDGIRLMHRVCENADMYYISNENLYTSSVGIRLNEKAYVINSADGEIVRCDEDILTLEICSGDMFVVMLTDDEIAISDKLSLGNAVTVDKCTIKREKQFVLDEMTSYMKNIDESPIEAKFGDWREYVGESFSGTCIYEAELSLSEITDCLMDLGSVKYTCEAIVNGVSLGVKVMPPYTFKIPREILKKDNIFTLRVSNTVANEYYYTKTFDKWAEWLLSSYYKISSSFDCTSLESGLLGPVKLYRINKA